MQLFFQHLLLNLLRYSDYFGLDALGPWHLAVLLVQEISEVVRVVTQTPSCRLLRTYRPHCSATDKKNLRISLGC